ncbi:MAG TPA: site-specific integrase [Solirubrobacterales bacterium]|nr:site-specific integrase [Solirubrobacterales bacterium]
MMLRDRQLPDADEVSFAIAAELMLRDLEGAGRKPTTLDNYRAILRFRLLPRFGKTAVDRVRKSQVEALAADMLREGKSAHTRDNTLKLLTQIFKFAQLRNWCRENPCQGVRRPRIRQSEDIRFLGKAELEALLEAIDVSEVPFGSTDRAMILTAAMTGMRQGELLALRWRDVDWQARRIRVRRNYVRGHWVLPKSRSGERSIPLSSRVAEELRAHLERSIFPSADDLVFAHPLSGEPLPNGPLVRRFKKALKAAGVREIRFHDLRHTFGTRIAAAGIPMRTLQEWMGHRDFRTTLIYADYEPRENESAMVDQAFS